MAGVSAAALLLAGLLYAARSTVPIWDDGALVLTGRLPATIESLLTPYHQHLDAIPILIWNELRSPAEMLAVLLLTHVALAAGTAAFLVRQLGAALGFALSLPLAVLGTAHYDLLMPWQILFTIPLLCGLAATWASLPLERTWARRAVVAASMVVAIASSTVGLFVVLALGLWFLFAGRRRQVWELAPALGVWIVWFVTFGLSGLGTDGASRATFASIVPYTLTAIVTGVGGYLGLGALAGGAVVAAAFVYLMVRRPAVHPAFAGFALAIVAMFVVGSLFRSYGSTEQATTSRYIYLVAFFLAFGIAASAPRITLRPPVVIAAGIVAAGLNLLALVMAVPAYP